MDPTTSLIVIAVLILAERHAARSTMIARLALDVMRERQRANAAEARLETVRAEILRARAHMRQGLAPIVQRYGIDDPDLTAMSGILHQITEGDDGVN